MPIDDPDLRLAIELVEQTPLTMQVTLDGELDLSGAAYLAEALECVPEGAAVVLDVARVGFIDSSGIRVLVACGLERPTRIVRPSPSVVRVCALAGVEHLLDELPSSPPVVVTPSVVVTEPADGLFAPVTSTAAVPAGE